ncbi:MAG: hypothetical protein JWP07_1493 [Pseudonocardiales bacterium]|jgi:hypothetical protein|nr:hypothetical protein [Pseudonocardiales bacterium]
MTGPTGDVVIGAGRYTHCVDKSAYYNLKSFGLGAGLASLGKDACDYLLGRKLVCLGGVRCAIGTIVFIEPVGFDKPFPDDIDNDFCVNLLLFPHEVEQFGPGTGATDKLTNWHEVTSDGVQGTLILHDPKDMPTPKEPAADPTPYSVTYLFGAGPPTPYEPKDDGAERLLEEVKQDASGIKRIDIPVLHCEFEGSRIFLVCSAIAPFLDLATGGPGAGACRAAIGWIPFLGDAICTVIETAVAIALAPLMLAAAAAAWAEAAIVDDLFVTGPVSRRVELGESVIVTGVWTWDGGHSGWNEFHATHTLQKVVLPTRTTAGFPADEARSFVERWCGLVSQVPPPTDQNGQPLTAMTPEQQDTHDRQARPENQWTLHPDVDGCRPRDDDPAQPHDMEPIR